MSAASFHTDSTDLHTCGDSPSAASKSRPWCECDPDYDGRCPYPCQIDADEKREAASAASIWRRILRGIAPGSYSDRAIRERRAAARLCTCPPAVGKDDCPVHGYIPIFDHNGRQLA